MKLLINILLGEEIMSIENVSPCPLVIIFKSILVFASGRASSTDNQDRANNVPYDLLLNEHLIENNYHRQKRAYMPCMGNSFVLFHHFLLVKGSLAEYTGGDGVGGGGTISLLFKSNTPDSSLFVSASIPFVTYLIKYY